ncbi:KRAB domain-containing zinc finger protein [Fusarium oxysporum NRRL 32931]|uniref:KRAB domain-containing zinc finger protein n=1 Tax=Fusarium oxysporum NRRL 32931 TaxID=660029 RepID=W9HG13_FUSOX|nr:KRAB domain-containing zinc finger protein [Fusarium oxysporum NRRL 32931]
MELVEQQYVARPFQCDWRSCTKGFNSKTDLQRHYRIHTNERPYACSISECGKRFIQKSALTVHIRTHTGEKPHQCQHLGCGWRFSDSSSFARHRSIHTGARYKCAHNGCFKSFSRKTTMVKHQRRPHQKEMKCNDILGDCSLGSDDDEPPSTPQHSAMSWPPRDIVSIEQATPHGPLHREASYVDLNQQVHDQHMLQQYANQHGIPSSVSQEFHDQPIPDYYVGASTPRRITTMSRQMYYVTEQGNPEVVTMTNAAQPHYQLPQQVERRPTGLPYSTLAIAASIQSSPRTFSATSFSSPMVQECFYTYLLRNQPEYAQTDFQQSIIQYQQPMQQLMSQPQQEKWPNDDLPIGVTAIGQLPAYGTAVYDPYGPMIEVDDPWIQLPSGRLASM